MSIPESKTVARLEASKRPTKIGKEICLRKESRVYNITAPLSTNNIEDVAIWVLEPSDLHSSGDMDIAF
ncbi:hypothetical protein BH18THE2_BH18THE2_21150 [soil metagenome]